MQGGSPPDRFFAGGQSWGFRPLHPQRMREDGYRFFVAALRRAFQHADCLRIDHVMGLQRMYMIPDGHAATEGAYVSYRAEELHALVALEASRAGAVVVGEDLGTVPKGVRERMARDRMLRTWVLQFESTPAQPLPRPAANTLASIGTHDLPRFGAFLWGEDIDERERAGASSPADAAAERAARTRWRLQLFDALGLDPAREPGPVTAAALHGCLRHMARSEADIVLVDLEEMWDERQAQNHPGTDVGGQLEPAGAAHLRGLLVRPGIRADVGGAHGRACRMTAGMRTIDEFPGADPITADDVHWFNEGTHRSLGWRLGGHPVPEGGARFAVWAPNARAVSVIGDFNFWDESADPLQSLGHSGIWEVVVPAARVGQVYKFAITSQQGHLLHKADPFAHCTGGATADRLGPVGPLVRVA